MTLGLAGMTYRADFLAEPFGPGSICADYQASDHERQLVERAFAGTNSGTNLSTSERNSEQEDVPEWA